MDKNETKNIAIIILTIFLAFSFIVNVYYYVASQTSSSNNDLSAYYGFKSSQIGVLSFFNQNGEVISFMPGIV